jgi:hypothetical protein
MARFSGWWRLWIAAFVIYGAVIAVFTWNFYPRIEGISYEPSHLKRLSDRTLQILGGHIQPPIPTDRPGFHPDPITLEMPNGHTFEVLGNTTVEQSTEVAKDYVSVLNSIANERRISTLQRSFLTWAIPSILVLALFGVARWVYRGFGSTSTSPLSDNGNAMDLEEFVTQSLVQLVQGVKQANVKLAGKEKTTADEKAFLLTYSGGDHPMGPHVEFDVAVSIKTDRKATAGASGKLYVVGIEASGSNSTTKENVSRVRFAVLVKEHQG